MARKDKLMCTGMKIEANRMISNFDFDAFEKWCKNKGISKSEIAKDLGYNASFFSNCRTRNAIKIGVYKSLLTIYELPEGAFLKEENPVEQAPAEPIMDAPPVDLSGLEAEVKALEIAVDRLGNIMAELLEYVGDIKKLLE